MGERQTQLVNFILKGYTLTKSSLKTGIIHGRFQILHKDHVKYIMAGKARCRHLIVGITNPDPLLTGEETSDPERSSRLSNPLTYYERFLLVKTVMKENNVGPDDYSVVPFPVNKPELYRYYVPREALYFLTIYDDWGRQKLKYFQSLNLETQVLWEVSAEQKGMSSSTIRKLMTANEPWEHMVPQGVASLMHRWRIPERLIGIQAGNYD